MNIYNLPPYLIYHIMDLPYINYKGTTYWQEGYYLSCYVSRHDRHTGHFSSSDLESQPDMHCAWKQCSHRPMAKVDVCRGSKQIGHVSVSVEIVTSNFLMDLTILWTVSTLFCRLSSLCASLGFRAVCRARIGKMGMEILSMYNALLRRSNMRSSSWSVSAAAGRFKPFTRETSNAMIKMSKTPMTDPRITTTVSFIKSWDCFTRHHKDF